MWDFRNRVHGGLFSNLSGSSQYGRCEMQDIILRNSILGYSETSSRVPITFGTNRLRSYRFVGSPSGICVYSFLKIAY